MGHSCIKQLTCVVHLKRTSTFKHPDYVIHLLTLRYVFMVGELGKAAWAPQMLPTFLWMANFSTSVILIALNLPCWNPQMPSLGGKGRWGGARCVEIFISMVGAGSKKGQGRWVWSAQRLVHCYYDWLHEFLKVNASGSLYFHLCAAH